ncbi:MAG: phage major capsid protein, partial [Desulfonatronovibrio sp.]
WGGTQGYWTAEAGEITKSQPKFRALELSLKKMACLAYASDEIIQDANVLAKIISQSFMDEMSFMLNDAILRGTGSGMPLGVLSSDATIVADAEDGQDADTLVYENILAMWSRLLPRSKKNAIWLLNPDVESSLYSMSLAVGTGGSPVFLPGGQASDQPFSTLFGRPIIQHESCSTLGDLGDIVLGDFTNGYILADKASGPQMASSISVRFEYDEMAYRMTYRCDGQPLLSAPITPAQGSNTLSHFVTLAAR